MQAINQITDIEDNRPDTVTLLQAKVAELYVLGGLSKADAIKQAGYKHQQGGYQALRLPHVRDYITVLIREHLQDSSVVAIRTVHGLMTEARSDYVRLEAAKDVMDRAGFKPVEKHAHLHGGEVSIRIELD